MTAPDITISSITGVIKLQEDFDILTFATFYDQFPEFEEVAELSNFEYGDVQKTCFFAFLELKFRGGLSKIKLRMFHTKRIQFTGAHSVEEVDKLEKFFNTRKQINYLQKGDYGFQRYYFDLYLDKRSNLIFSATLKRLIGKLLPDGNFVIDGKRAYFDIETGVFKQINRKNITLYNPNIYHTYNPDVDLEIIFRLPKVFSVEIVNIWAASKLHTRLDLQELANDLAKTTTTNPYIQFSYQPSVYKGINIRMYNSNMQKVVSIIIRATGLVLLSGRSVFNIESNFTYLWRDHIVHNHNRNLLLQQVASLSDIF